MCLPPVPVLYDFQGLVQGRLSISKSYLQILILEVVGSGPRSGCHKISSRSATCGEMQNLVSHNPEICHKFLSKYSGAVYVVYTSRKQCLVSNLWQKFPPVKRLCHRFYTVGPSCWVVQEDGVHACTIDSSICSFTCPYLAENCKKLVLIEGSIELSTSKRALVPSGPPLYS